MAQFYLSKNADFRTPPDPQLIQWLSQLDDTFHILLGVLGPDFKSDCLLLKRRGIINLHPDPTKYRVALRNGEWIDHNGDLIANPSAVLEDQTNRIRDYLLKILDKIFPANSVNPATLHNLSPLIQVFWLIALTHRYVKSDAPTTSGRILSEQESV